MRTLVIDLPLPPERLHPNVRGVVWQERARMVKKARGESAFLAKRAIGDLSARVPWTPFMRAIIKATFYMPRKRDTDGLISWLKSYLDGLQGPDLVIKNDSGFSWEMPVQITGKLAKGRRAVVLTIEELP